MEDDITVHDRILQKLLSPAKILPVFLSATAKAEREISGQKMFFPSGDFRFGKMGRIIVSVAL